MLRTAIAMSLEEHSGISLEEHSRISLEEHSRISLEEHSRISLEEHSSEEEEMLALALSLVEDDSGSE